MAERIQVLREAHFANESDEPVELLIPAGESVEVFYDDARFSYIVSSSEAEQQSVVLQPREYLWLR